MSASRRCEIVVRGLVGPITLQAFPALTCRRRGGDTLLTGAVEDQAALFGVLLSVEALGLELVELRVYESPEPDEDASSGLSRAFRPHTAERKR